MKKTLLFLLLFIKNVCFAQSEVDFEIEVVETYTTQVHPSKAIIYGQFYGKGFPNSILLYRFDDKLEYPIRLNGRFIYSITPGKYAILMYVYPKSKWDGSIENMVDIIYKNGTQKEVVALLKSGELKESEIQRYTFTVEAGRVNYLGTWNFEDKIPVFIDEKQRIDKKMQKSKSFVYLDLGTAVTNMPK
jgi:hypothetical protein